MYGVQELAAAGLPVAAAQALGGSVDAVTATASGTQSNSLLIANTITRVGTVATTGDSVVLPYAVPGAYFIVANGSQTKFVTVFGSGSDTVNGIAGATGFPLPPGKTGIFVAPAAAKWTVNLSA